MPVTSGNEPFDGSGLESSGDTGVEFAETGGGQVWTDDDLGGHGSGGGGRPGVDDIEDIEDAIADLGGRELSEEGHRRVEQAAEINENRREHAAEQAAEQATKEAEMAAAHANDDPYMWETTTIDGVEVEVWKMPDGSTAYYDRETETVVEMEWPPGEGPVYQGNMLHDGEAVSVYELPDGTIVLVDENGTTVGYGDEIVSDTFYDPAWGQVYAVPQGPPTYDTILYDAETGDVLVRVNTGSATQGMIEGYDNTDTLFRYYPPGADYYLVIDEDGTVIDQVEIPPDEVIDFMGVLTVYDDGEVVIDLGVGELHVDVIGDEGGISFEVDGGAEELFGGSDWLGTVEAGVEWDEDGVEIWAEADVLDVGHIGAGAEIGKDGFEVWVEADGDIGAVGFDVEGRMGLTEDGEFYAGGEIGFDMNIGLIDIEGSVNGYVEVGPEGFEMSGGWDGKVGMLGAYVEGGQQGSLAYGEDGFTATYEEYRGAGVVGVGSVRIGTELQLQTDGTRDGTSLTGGLYGSTNDADGDETGMIGVYTELDSDGFLSPWVTDEHLDTGVTMESYDRHHDREEDTSGIPAGPDGSADIDAEFPETGPDGEDPGGRRGAGSRDAFDQIERNPAVTSHRVSRSDDIVPDEPAGDAVTVPGFGTLQDTPRGDDFIAFGSEGSGVRDGAASGYIGETEKNLDRDRGAAGESGDAVTVPGFGTLQDTPGGENLVPFGQEGATPSDGPEVENIIASGNATPLGDAQEAESTMRPEFGAGIADGPEEPAITRGAWADGAVGDNDEPSGRTGPRRSRSDEAPDADADVTADDITSVVDLGAQAPADLPTERLMMDAGTMEAREPASERLMMDASTMEAADIGSDRPPTRSGILPTGETAQIDDITGVPARVPTVDEDSEAPVTPLEAPAERIAQVETAIPAAEAPAPVIEPLPTPEPGVILEPALDAVTLPEPEPEPEPDQLDDGLLDG